MPYNFEKELATVRDTAHKATTGDPEKVALAKLVIELTQGMQSGQDVPHEQAILRAAATLKGKQ
jgi:hypothetical protein